VSVVNLLYVELDCEDPEWIIRH